MSLTSGLRRIGWTGIVLVLLNVFVPVMSHLLRSADTLSVRQAHREMVLAVAGDWCVSGGGGQITADELRTLSSAVSLDATLRHLSACDFCDDAPLAGGALPLPEVTGVDPAPLVASAVRFTAFATAILRRQAFRLPLSHAPPQV
ncbi:MAG: hypothetical protein RL654_1698 [Pseudomonadota bacterium]|jgi:hypothetical protein